MLYRNWSEPLYMPALLLFEIWLLHIAGSWGQQLTGNRPQVALYELGYGHLQILLEGCSGIEEGCRKIVTPSLFCVARYGCLQRSI
jgi:hypothetical protein